MDAKELPARPNLEHFRKLAKALVKAFRLGDAASLKRLQDHFKRRITLDEVRLGSQRQLQKLKCSPATGKLTLTDAQFLVARSHAFESWPKFVKHIEAVRLKRSPASRFEAAADAVIAGDIAALERMLRQNPELVHERSTRTHHATLLHYVAANGVEDFRQKTPKNIVEVTKLLLRAGAEVDAEDNQGRGTTLGLAATSCHPANAGVQIALLETLLEAGASPDGLDGGWNPLTAALHNGRGDAAAFLASRGARLDLEGAIGVGNVEAVKSFFTGNGRLRPTATKKQMVDGFMWACQYGHTNTVEFLLDQGFDVAAKAGCTGLHWAAYTGHADTVRLLLQRKAPVNAKDDNFDGTPLGWALYGWADPPSEAERDSYYMVAALLTRAGGTADVAWLSDPNRERPIIQKVNGDERMQAALRGEIPG